MFLALEVDGGETHDAVGDFEGGGGAADGGVVEEGERGEAVGGLG